MRTYAQSFGIRAYRPQAAAELGPQLQAALASRELCLVEIPTDPSANDELTRRLRAGAGKSGAAPVRALGSLG